MRIVSEADLDGVRGQYGGLTSEICRVALTSAGVEGKKSITESALQAGILGKRVTVTLPYSAANLMSRIPSVPLKGEMSTLQVRHAKVEERQHPLFAVTRYGLSIYSQVHVAVQRAIIVLDMKSVN